MESERKVVWSGRMNETESGEGRRKNGVGEERKDTRRSIKETKIRRWKERTKGKAMEGRRNVT